MIVIMAGLKTYKLYFLNITTCLSVINVIQVCQIHNFIIRVVFLWLRHFALVKNI